MTLEELRQKFKPQIIALAAKYHCSNVRVFGSLARGTATASSDIDLLVHPSAKANLFHLGELWMDLRDLLKQDVDLVPDTETLYYDTILKEAVPL